jgi:hypothetical protein
MATKYCPECRKDCGTTECAINDAGRCAHCGKPPVASTERGGTWVWCASHDAWHRETCAAHPTAHCCRPVAA